MEDEDYDENHQSSPLRLARHLTSLAHEFLNSLNPLHAILALETTFQNPQAKFPSSMNIEEVKNRKLIGSILNAITENQAEAKRHLEFGKVVLKDHARYEVLKYETFYELAIANRNLVPTDGEKAKKMEEESLNNCLEPSLWQRQNGAPCLQAVTLAETPAPKILKENTYCMHTHHNNIICILHVLHVI